ncbi:MAG: DNA methyltransferase, partial [Chloroflexota bacterium]
MAPASLFLLLTDPPYDTVHRHGGEYLRHWFRGSLSWPQIGRILGMARRRMAADGQAMVLTNEAGLPAAQAAVRAAGFARQRLVVWDKQQPGLGSGLRHQVEYVVVGLQPGSRTLAGRDLVSVPAVASRLAGRYPTEKPIELGRQLAAIAGVRRGDLVVDPFCGSGALLVGAADRGARVLGGDISARAVAIATRRLAALAPRPAPGPAPG